MKLIVKKLFNIIDFIYHSRSRMLNLLWNFLSSPCFTTGVVSDTII